MMESKRKECLWIVLGVFDEEQMACEELGHNIEEPHEGAWLRTLRCLDARDDEERDDDISNPKP